MWDKLINVLGYDWYKADKMKEQSIICRARCSLECVGNRHYWKLMIMLPNEPCNCGSYAYQPDEPDGYRKSVKGVDL